MGLCKCEGSHRFREIGSWDGCPLEGGSHTAFIVCRCWDCGGISFFPRENGDLALSKGNPAVKAKLNEIITGNEQRVE